MLILGIETSCDETSVALAEAKAGGFIVHENLISSQVRIHEKYGGIVPEVAARRHVETIIPLLKKISRNGKMPDVVAVTAGPGLAVSLLVGAETARTLAYLWKKPLVAVNHLEGHIYSNWLPPCHSELDQKSRKQQSLDSRLSPIFMRPWFTPHLIRGRDDNKIFPILCLIVSGGHTELILMKGHLKYKLIGQTLDDAVGECFDKVGKMLGLPYPGGPEVAKMDAKGDPGAIKFPRPMIDSPDFNFSFSGLKTAVLYFLKNNRQKTRNNLIIPDICASFQQAAVEVLIAKTATAAQKYGAKTILLGGGVAANQTLRKSLSEKISSLNPAPSCLLPDPSYCSDNAAMIAAAGYFRALKKDFTPWQKLNINPNWELA